MRFGEHVDIALVMYGNISTMLGNSRFNLAIPKKHLFNDIAEIKFVRKVTGQSYTERLEFSGVPKWLDYLSVTGAKRLWYTSDAIQIDFESTHEIWSGDAVWSTESEGLSCKYHGHPSIESQVKHIDLQVAKANLREVMQKAATHSEETLGDEYFVQHFRKALSVLDMKEPEVISHLMGAVPEEGYSLTTYQVLAGVFEGWCWWGMSDFQDIADSEEHNSVVDLLSSAMKDGVKAAVNSCELSADKIQKYRGAEFSPTSLSAEFISVNEPFPRKPTREERKEIRRTAEAQ